MGKQFFYTRKQVLPAPKDSDKEILIKECIDSFDIEEVLRTVENEDGSLLVALKDGHEESRPVGREPSKNGKEGALIKARIWVQSQIELEGVDVARFRNVAKVFEYGESISGSKSPEGKGLSILDTPVTEAGESTQM